MIPRVAAAPGPLQHAAVCRYQAFPCVRLHCPGELTIGPHCDAAYGHEPRTLNVTVPLTAAAGTSALVTESAPGREDWHSFEVGAE